MGVLLYHDTNTDGKVHLAEGKVAGSPTPKRVYQQDGHFLHVEGQDHVVEHDVEEIQRIPGWRLATPQEQNQFFGEKRQETTIHEAPTKDTPKGRTHR
jgi:hypothetical protein